MTPIKILCETLLGNMQGLANKRFRKGPNTEKDVLIKGIDFLLVFSGHNGAEEASLSADQDEIFRRLSESHTNRGWITSENYTNIFLA